MTNKAIVLHRDHRQLRLAIAIVHFDTPPHSNRHCSLFFTALSMMKYSEVASGSYINSFFFFAFFNFKTQKTICIPCPRAGGIRLFLGYFLGCCCRYGQWKLFEPAVETDVRYQDFFSNVIFFKRNEKVVMCSFVFLCQIRLFAIRYCAFRGHQVRWDTISSVFS